MTARFWTCATITAVSALVSASFSVAGLFGPSGSDIFERYAASRSIALLIAVLCCIGVLLADGHCCSGAGHDAGSRFRRPNRRSRTGSREHLGPFCSRPREPRCTGVVAAFRGKQQRLAKNFRHAPSIHDFRPHRSARRHGAPGSLRKQWPLPPVGSDRRRAHTRALVAECAPRRV